MEKLKRYLLITALIIAIGIIAVIGYFNFSKEKKFSVLGDDIKFYLYTVNGESAGGAVISLPFVALSEERWFINILADLDRNGTLDISKEWVAKNQIARILKDYRNNITFSLGEAKLSTGDDVLIKIMLSQEVVQENWNGKALKRSDIKEVSVKVSNWELSEILGLNVPTSPEGWFRGPSPEFSFLAPEVVASSHEGGVSASRGNVPDLPQDPMACAPTSIANNVISLAEENGALDELYENLPSGPWGVMDGLKQDMQYDEQAGVRPANVLSGKQSFIERYNLPIVTEVKENPTAQDIAEALSSGAALEASFALEVGASGRFTGHMVSVVGVQAGSGGTTQLQYHDGATPDGMDTLNLGSQVEARGKRGPSIDYPLWKGGIEFIDFIIIERWVGTTQSARTGPQTTEGESTSLVEMLVVNGHYFPKSQFRIANPDACGAQHYHAAGTVYGLRDKNSTEIINMTDPNPTSCGFGKISEVPVVQLAITYEQSIELIKYVVP